MMNYKNILIRCLILFIVHVSSIMYSQYFEYQKESFLKNYETDYSKGKIDVNVPLLSLPTTKNLKINVGLSYNTDSATGENEDAPGLGWTLINGGGVISKYMYLGLNDNNQVYQYNFLGRAGRFYVRYDSNLNDLKAIESYPSKNKIIIQKESDTIFTGFKIIDENGLKYVFDKKNISYAYEYPHFTTNPNHPSSNPTPKKHLYTSAFHLTKILDEKDNIIVNYEFSAITKVIATGKSTVRNILNKIEINNIGTINFSNNSIVTKNKSNQIINNYIFYNSNSNYTSRNLLTHVVQKDKNNAVINTHSFLYNYPEDYFDTYSGGIFDIYGYASGYSPCILEYDNFYQLYSVNPGQVKTDLLKAIVYPTGGRVEYDYESNVIPITPYSYSYKSIVNNFYALDYKYGDFEIDVLADFDFDTLNSNSNIFTLNNTGNYAAFLIKTSHDFHPASSQPGHPNTSTLFSYNIKNPNNANNLFPLKNYYYVYDDPTKICNSIKEFNPGNTNNLKITFTGGKSFGNVKIIGVKKTSRDYRYAKGVRIKEVKTFESNSVNPVSYIQFDYNLFSNPAKSSGYFYLDIAGYESGFSLTDGSALARDQEMTLYENVKITDAIKNTSVKYTYMMPDEIYSNFGNGNEGYLQFDFNHPIKKMGLIKKLEKFDSDSNLIEKTENTPNIEYVIQPGINDEMNNPFKVLFIKSSTSNNQLKVENTLNILYSSSQNFFEPEHNLLTKSLSTDFSGTITEQKIFYPKDLNNQKLLNANLLSVPLKTELLLDGELTSKSETKFDDPATVYPTSQIAYDLQNQNPQTLGTVENYDEMGNIREIKDKSGISTVTIWGYHKTQPIAVIMGVTYAQVAVLPVIIAAINASDADNDNSANEGALLQALDNLRKDAFLKNYQMTTYTYDPLIGVTTTTSPSGFREINIYDSANRLLKVTDNNGKTLKEFKYNYKQ